MAEIIFSTPMRRRPGPNGIPGAVCRRHAEVFAAPARRGNGGFATAWYGDCGGHWAAPLDGSAKDGGSEPYRAAARPRMPNEHRKILARAVARVIGEAAERTMSQIQQAFLRERDIVRSNVAIHGTFYRAVAREELRAWFLLDSTKGYNFKSWNWTRRVLEHARCRPGLFRAIMRLVEEHPSVILVLQRLTCSPTHFRSSLAQGCPLSCVLCVIAVGPVLDFLAAQAPGVSVVAGHYWCPWPPSGIIHPVVRSNSIHPVAQEFSENFANKICEKLAENLAGKSVGEPADRMAEN